MLREADSSNSEPDVSPLTRSAHSPTRQRRWRFRIGAILLALAVFPGLPELCVRMADPPLNGFRAIYFDGDERTPELFVNDTRLSWRIRPRTQVEFLGVRVATDEHGFRTASTERGRRTVLCLGDSTTFGWKIHTGQCYADVLHTLLNQAAPRGGVSEWQVLNAGVPGYSSYQVRRQAEQLVPRWKPEIVVVCVGNNDGWPVERADHDALEGQGGLRTTFVDLMSCSRFALWVKDRATPYDPPPLILPTLDRAVPRVSRDEYRDNLRAIVATAQQHGATVILATPPVNLYHAPTRGDQFPGFAELQHDSRRVAEFLSSGDRDEGLKLLAHLRREHHDDFRYRWLEGAALSKLGQVDEGRELLEAALELDPFPEGCKRSYRRAMVELAEELGLPVVDINGLFVQQAKPATPERLYLDWCHPVVLGHRLIAAALREAIGNR